MTHEDEPVEGYADRLRARAEATDRAGRFEERLAVVERVRQRRRVRRRVARVVLVPVAAGAAVLLLLLVAAVVNAPSPDGTDQLVAAGVGAVLGIVGPVVRDALARRRGAAAWDWHRERYVLLGDPSRQVRDADRPRQTRDGPPPPTR